MSLPDKRDHSISISKAADLTRRHRTSAPKEDHGGVFHPDAYEALLKQPRCARIRIYRGRGEGGAHHFVIVGVDAQGADMTSGAVMQQNWTCPPYCCDAHALL